MTQSRAPQERIVTIRPRPLTREAFAPFGKVLDGEPMILTSTHFPMFAQIVTLQPAVRDVRKINRHHDHTQLFAAVNGEPMLLIVAPPDMTAAEFDPEQIAAFSTSGPVAIVFHVGTWHTAPRAIGTTPTRALNVQATDYQVHTELIDVEETTGARVEVELAGSPSALREDEKHQQ